ncbi:hypothetical protein ACSBR1_032098 [Camellia fascicularis]
MVNVEPLDLSSNQLSGVIPPELTSLRFLEVLNVSYNNLSGIVPRGFQFDTFGNDCYMGDFGLCGFLLSQDALRGGWHQSTTAANRRGC